MHDMDGKDINNNSSRKRCCRESLLKVGLGL